MPLVFVGLPLVFGIGYGIFGGGYLVSMAFKMNVRSSSEFLLKMFMILISFPVGVIILGLCTAGGAVVSAIGAILIVPALLLHVYVFTRSVIWWNKNRVTKK